LLVSGVLLLIGVWNGYRGRIEAAAILGALGIILSAIGLFVPPLARRFHVAWMKLAMILGNINSRILLSVMFYGVIAPIGFMTRIAGRNPLKRRGAGSATYWVPRPVTRQTREGFERSF
jgi:hypothetical protein